MSLVVPSRAPRDYGAWRAAVERGLTGPPPGYCEKCVLDWARVLGEEVIAKEASPQSSFDDPVLAALEDLASRVETWGVVLPSDWSNTLLGGSRRAFDALPQSARSVASIMTDRRNKMFGLGVKYKTRIEVDHRSLVCIGSFVASAAGSSSDRHPGEATGISLGFEQWIDRDAHVYRPSLRGGGAGDHLEAVAQYPSPGTSIDPFYYGQGWDGSWPHPGSLLDVLTAL